MPQGIKPTQLVQVIGSDRLALYFYDVIQKDYFDWETWSMVRSETSAEAVRNALAQHPNVSHIDVYINSAGGSVYEGTAIYNQLKRHPAEVTVHVDGFACSIASVIAMAGDTIIMPRNTCMFIHEMQDCLYGNAAAHRKCADDLDVLMEASRQVYLERSGGMLEETVLVDMLRSETWLTAEQCIHYGLADQYAEQEADMVQATAQLNLERLPITQQAAIGRNLAARLRSVEPTPPEPESLPKSGMKAPANRLMALFQINKEG